MTPQAIRDVSALFAANAMHTLQHDRHDPHSDLAAKLVRDRALQMMRGAAARPQTLSGAR